MTETTTQKENTTEAGATTPLAPAVAAEVTPPAAAKLAPRKAKHVDSKKPAPVASVVSPPTVAPLAEATPESTAPASSAKEGRHKKPVAKKARLVRDSFTFPEAEYALFAVLKQRTLAAGIDIKKSELVRAGLSMLNGLTEDELVKVLGNVERIKTGRPKK